MTTKPPAPAAIEGVFQHVIYSPKGEIEGALVACGREPAQVVVGQEDERLAEQFLSLTPGRRIVVHGRPQAPSPKGAGAHSVIEGDALVSVDGARPGRPERARLSGYAGKVVRLNYARHGEPNGVVLDSGDFIHLKPDGMARLKLQVGDHVEAEGDAQRLVDDLGWAVEATHVNGKPVKSH